MGLSRRVGVLASGVAMACGGLLDSDDAPQSGGTAAAGGASGGGGASAGDASAGGGGSGALSAGDCEVAGYEDCNGLPGDGCEVDTTSDPQHCGECGHACGSDQACTATGCTVGFEVVVDGQLFRLEFTQGGGDDIVAAGARLYFAVATGEIQSVLKTGGELELLHESRLSSGGLAADSSYVYALFGGIDFESVSTEVWRTPIDQGRFEVVVQQSEESGKSLAVESNRPVWVSQEFEGRVFAFVEGEVRRIQSATQIRGEVLSDDAAVGRSALAMNQDWIFWPWETSQGRGQIVRFDLAGENLSVLEPDVGAVLDLEVCGNRLYWVSTSSSSSAGAVGRSSLSGEQATTLQTLEPSLSPQAIACDERAAYWLVDHSDLTAAVTDGQGSVWGIRHDQMLPTAIVEGLDHPQDITLDSNSIYWSVAGERDEAEDGGAEGGLELGPEPTTNGAILSLPRDVLE